MISLSRTRARRSRAKRRKEGFAKPSLSIIVFLSFLLANNVFATEIIDVNIASLDDLVKIIHIGEVRAKELISLRPFSSLDDLTRIKGIGEKSLEDIKEQGLAWVSGEARTESQENYPEAIVINEILPSPEGTDAEKEWIEICNQNNFEVNVSGWQITDIIGQTQGYVFPEGSIIKPGGFFLLSRPETKITLNNGGDELRLMRLDGSIADSVIYESAPNGQSFNRSSSGWTWSTVLTPGSENIITVQETRETERVEKVVKIDINTAPLKDLVKITNIGEIRAQELISLRPFYSLDELAEIKGVSEKTIEDIKNQGLAWIDPKLEPPKIERGMAAVAEPLKTLDLSQGKKTPKLLSVLPIAITLAIFSGAAILILKKKIKED